jgi:hypothetical protein
VAKPPGDHIPLGGFVFLSCRLHMDIANVDTDEWDSLFDRRSTGRTKIAKGALLFFGQQVGVLSCTVTDITNTGAGLRTRDMALIPLTFEMTFDNFRTIRECRLIWRAGDFLGVAFKN